MAVSQQFETIIEFKGSITSQAISAGGSYEHRIDLPKGYKSGICMIANVGDANSGGVFMFTDNANDATGRSAHFFTGQVSASGGAAYSFLNWRPEIYNKGIDGFVSDDNSFGTSVTTGVQLSELYIDTSTDELFLEFTNNQSASRVITCRITGKVFSHIEVP